MRLGGPQSYSGRFGEEKRVFPLPGCDHRIVRPVASHYTELSRIHCQQMRIFCNSMQSKAATVHVDACKWRHIPFCWIVEISPLDSLFCDRFGASSRNDGFKGSAQTSYGCRMCVQRGPLQWRRMSGDGGDCSSVSRHVTVEHAARQFVRHVPSHRLQSSDKMCPGSGAEDPFNLKIFFSIDLEAQKGFLSPDSNL